MRRLGWSVVAAAGVRGWFWVFTTALVVCAAGPTHAEEMYMKWWKFLG